MRIIVLMLLAGLACTPPAIKGAVKVSTPDSTIYAGATYFDMLPDSLLGDRIVAFAKTQIGVEYRFCSMDPINGFDCSGFVNYVFHHFEITVPRSSVEFTNIGDHIDLKLAEPGDLILFTGTNALNRTVGHIGIILSNTDGDIKFIHSSSGKEYSVTVTSLNDYYMGRFMKVIRINGRSLR